MQSFLLVAVAFAVGVVFGPRVRVFFANGISYLKTKFKVAT